MSPPDIDALGEKLTEEQTAELFVAAGTPADLEAACHEASYLRELLTWAYSKLHARDFSGMDDALMLDRINLYLQHGIAA